MARLQILQLPEGAGDERPPFILVIDQVSDAADYVHMTGNPERLGARAILVFAETIEIPANEVPVAPDGHPLKIRVEGDFEKFREQVEQEVRNATNAMQQYGR